MLVATVLFLATLSFLEADESAKVAELLEPGSIKQTAELIASRVEAYATQRSKKIILVGRLDGVDTSGGRGLEEEIKVRLQGKGVEILKNDSEVVSKQGWKLVGKISKLTEKALLLVKVELLDHEGEEVAEFREQFNQDEAVKEAQEEIPSEKRKANSSTLPITGTDAAILDGSTLDGTTAAQEEIGKTADVFAPVKEDAKAKVEAGAKVRDAVIQEGISSPSFSLNKTDSPDAKAQTIVRASDTSPFAIRIRRSSRHDGDYTAMPVQSVNGRPFVDLKKGDFYTVDILNESPIDIGAAVLVDGINTMRFAKDPNIKSSGKWIIRPDKKFHPILGWYKSQGFDGVDRFEVTDAKGAVAVQLGEAHSTGMIQVHFFSARPEGAPAPVVDAILGKPRGFTGRGPSTEFSGDVRPFIFGEATLALITIRYDNPDDLPR